MLSIPIMLLLLISNQQLFQSLGVSGLRLSIVVELRFVYYLERVCSGRFLVPSNTLVINGMSGISRQMRLDN